MGSTLEHGIYLPSEGEKNCYQGLAGNWNKVDGALGDVAELKQSIESKFTKEIVTELPTEDINPYCIYMILKTDPETDNVYDEWVYINNAWEYLGNTKVDMTQYYTKQEVNQLPAVASGVTATKVGNYDAHIANGDIHVTASDKAKWDTVALIKQLRLVNIQVGSATTIAFANIDDTNGIKVGDKCMDLDAKMFEITAVDTTNQTVTVGSALIDLALDANVMHLSGNETVAGIKNFTDYTYIKSLNFTNEVPSQSSSIDSVLPLVTTVTYTDQTESKSARINLRITANGDKSLYPHENSAYSLGLSSRLWSDFYTYHGYFRGQQQGDEYSSNARTNLTLLANRDGVGQSGCVVDTFRENTTQGTGSHILGIAMKENSVRYQGCRFSWFYDDDNNGYVFSLRPTKQGTNQPIKYELGNSLSKWDTINGINPGALSLPDLDNGIDISGYITVNGANKESLYTPPTNGWISVALTRTSGSVAVMLKQGNIASSGHRVEQENVTATCNATLPVKGGVQVSINSALADRIVFAYFYPCQGNV